MLINDIDLPDPVFHAMIANIYTSGSADYTASSIVYGAKEYWGKKGNRELKQDCSGLWSAFTGTLMHIGLQVLLEQFNEMVKNNHPALKYYTIPDGYYILEDRQTISFNEHSRFFKLEEDRKIGGAIDCRFYYNKTGKAKLYDYKTMTSTSLILEDKIKDFTEKANLYRWLMECCGNPISEIEYIPLFKDWSLTKAKRSGKIQEYPTMKLKLEMWDRKTIETFMYNRITEVEKYRNTPYSEIPYCNEAERWCGKPCFKVCKIKDGKVGNALPNCTFEHELNANAELVDRQLKAKKDEVFTVKKVGGVSTKCNNWCNLKTNGICDYEDK